MNYTTGTITLTNGSNTVTGTGTGWATALIAGGVIYPQAAGNPLPIASVDGNTQITAATEWVGSTGTYDYALARQDDANQVIANQVALAEYIARLDSDALSAIASLAPAADSLAYFSGASSAALTALSAFARSLLDDDDANEALSTLGVSAFAKTLLDDTDAAAVLTTLGVSAFAKTLLDDTDAAAVLTTLGVSAFAKTLLDDTDAAAVLTTLGVSAFAKTLLDDTSASAARTTLGAQASLGYTAANKAGEIFGGDVIARRSSADPESGGYKNSVLLKASMNAGGFSAMYFQEQAGIGERTIIECRDGAGNSKFMQFNSGGDLSVPGSINGSAKNFLIDHPLDPNNRYLTFASTESPHYGVEAWGVARLENGRATVDIDAASNLTPGTWAALTQNTIASLQNQEGFARLRPGPIAGGQFEIIAEDNACADLVAWHVVADRNDPVIRTLANTDPETGLLTPEARKAGGPA